MAAVLLMMLAAAGSALSATHGGGPSQMAIIAAFKKAGIPVTKSVIYNATTDKNHLLGRPGQYIAKVNWGDSRDASDGVNLGTIEFFNSESDLTSRENYIKTVEKGVPLLGQYIYADGLALMRLDFALTPAQAAKYQAVLKRLETGR